MFALKTVCFVYNLYIFIEHPKQLLESRFLEKNCQLKIWEWESKPYAKD